MGLSAGPRTRYNRGMNNPTVQKYVVSSIITFVSTFLVTLGGQIGLAGTIELNTAFIMGLLMIAGRAAAKAVLESIPLLGNAAKG